LPGETFRQLSGETASRIKDLVSRYNDLQIVRSVLGRLVDLQKSGSDDAILMQTFWATALVYYGRCFGKGQQRTITKGLVERLIGGHEQMHADIIQRRDKQAAHASERELDYVTVAAGFVPGEAGVRFNTVAIRNVRDLAPPTDTVAILLRHVIVVIARLAQVIVEHEQRLHAEVVEALQARQTEGLLGNDVTNLFVGERGRDQQGPLGGSFLLQRPNGPTTT